MVFYVDLVVLCLCHVARFGRPSAHPLTRELSFRLQRLCGQCPTLSKFGYSSFPLMCAAASFIYFLRFFGPTAGPRWRESHIKGRLILVGACELVYPFLLLECPGCDIVRFNPYL